jgi:hypothetical protein
MNCVIFHPATDISTELFCKFFATSMIPLLKQSPRGNRNDEVQYTENQGEEAPHKNNGSGRVCPWMRARSGQKHMYAMH